VRELSDIVTAATSALAQGHPSLLATIVRIEGSSYRRPGAMMLMAADAWLAGSVSGGCLERDLLRKAVWLTRNGPCLHTYDTSQDGDSASASLGCGGTITLLLEPMTAPLLEQFSDIVKNRALRRCAISLHEEELGGRLFLGPPQKFFSLPEARAQEISARKEDSAQVFWQWLRPAHRLVVVGAGRDSKPLLDLATRIGFDLHLVDFRAHFLSEHTVLQQHLLKPETLHQLPLEPGCAVLVQSHHFEYDKAVLTELCRRPMASFVGALGTAKRTASLLDNVSNVEALSSTLHSPVGIDVGGDEPEAVALSTLSQVHAVLQRGSLRSVAELKARRHGDS
jgi:xanthine dehydrogenase accessory factor